MDDEARDAYVLHDALNAMHQWILATEAAEAERLAGDPPRDPDDDDRVGCVELE